MGRFSKRIGISSTGWAYILLFCLLSGIGIYVFRDYFFSGKLFVFSGFASDTVHQFYADYYFRAQRLFSANFSFWSFRHDLGMDVYPLIAKLSPFDLLILLSGEEGLADAIGYVMLLKIITAGLLFFAFLRKVGIGSHAAIVGSVSFAYCGYMTVNGHWYHYLDYAVFASLILLLFERWFQDGKWILMVLAIGLAHLKGVLQIYQFFFFLSLYGLFRIVHERGFQVKETLLFWSKFSFFYGIGIGVGAFYLFPELYQAVSSARGGESVHKFALAQWIKDALTVSDPLSVRTFLLRLLSNDLTGSFERFRGVANYLEAPAAYAGLISVFAAPLVFVQKGRRQKAAFSLLAVCCLSYLLFPYFRVIGNAFASGTYKHTVMYNSIFLIFSASYSLDFLFRRKLEPNGFLFLSLSFFTGVLLLSWTAPEIALDPKIFRTVVTFFLFYASLFILFQFPRLREFAKYALLALIVFEVSVFARTTLSRSSGVLTQGFMERGERYFDQETLQAIETIRVSDDSFYRVEKGYISDYLNDAVVQGYYGTSAYYGFSLNGVVDFHRSLRISPQSPRIASYRYGLSKRDKLQSLLGVKYFLSKDPSDRPAGFMPVRSHGAVHVFQNQNFVPLGFTYSQYMTRADFEPLPLEKKEAVMLKAFVYASEYGSLKRVGPAQSGAAQESNGSDVLSRTTFQVQSFKEDHIQGKAFLDEPGMLFFAIPYHKGWKALVDGRAQNLDLINIAFMGLLLDPGEHHVELRFSPPYLGLGMSVSLLSIVALALLHRRFPRVSCCRPEPVRSSCNKAMTEKDLSKGLKKP